MPRKPTTNSSPKKSSKTKPSIKSKPVVKTNSKTPKPCPKKAKPSRPRRANNLRLDSNCATPEAKESVEALFAAVDHIVIDNRVAIVIRRLGSAVAIRIACRLPSFTIDEIRASLARLMAAGRIVSDSRPYPSFRLAAGGVR